MKSWEGGGSGQRRTGLVLDTGGRVRREEDRGKEGGGGGRIGWWL